MTKHPFFTFALLLSITLAQSQVKVGENPQNIDSASILELESTSRALVISRMNTSQMNAINPLEGAMVFNTEERCVFYYSGSAWINLCSEENTTNVALSLEGSDLILTDSDGNTVSVALEGAINQTFSTDAVENFRETIIITQTGDNFNFEVAQITGEQIADFTIQGVDFAPDSITEDKLAPLSVSQEKLQENAVADFQLDYNQVTLNDFTNDAGFLTNAQIISPDAGNIIINSNGAFYDNTPLLNDIATNAQGLNDHIAADGDLDDQNEIQDAAGVAVTAVGNLNSDNVQLALEELQSDVDNLNGGSSNTDQQNISTNNAPGNITIDNGNTININVNDGDFDDQNEIQDADEVLIDAITGITGDNVQVALEELQVNIESLNAGGGNTDEQTLATDGSPGNISISNGGAAITLNVEDGDSDDTNELQAADAVAIIPITGITGDNVQLALEELQTDVDNLVSGGGADGVVSNVAFDGTNLNFTGATGGFNGNVDISSLAGVNTDEQNLIAATLDGSNELTIEIENGNPVSVDLSALAGGGADGNDFINAGILNVESLELTGSGGSGATIDLSPFALDTDLAGFLTAEVDGSTTNELQDLDLNTNILTLSTPASPGNQVNLTPYLDNQIAIEVPFTPSGGTASDNVQAAIEELQLEIDGISTGGAANPNDELITDFTLTGTTLTITEDGVNWPVNLDPNFVTETELLTSNSLKEDTANKSTDVTLADLTNTLFPTELAVKTYVDNQIATVGDDDITAVSFDGTNLTVDEGATTFAADLSALEESADIAANTAAILLKEDAANKSTDVTLADLTNTLFPTELAVKTYVDNQIATVGDDDITAVSFDGTNLTVDEGATTFAADLSALEESADIAANTAAILLKEDAANKSTDVTLADLTNTLFPTELAVKTYVDNQIATVGDDDITAVSFDGTNLTVDEGATTFAADLSALEESADIAANTAAILLKEDAANKSTDVTLADLTNTLFPTELAVKTYVDNQIATVGDDDITAVSFDGTNLTVDEGATTFAADLSALEESADIAANTAAILLKEDAANKSTDVTLADLTNTLFPTELAVKTYVDNQIATVGDDDITAVSFDGTNLTVDEGATTFAADLSALEESADIAANTAAILLKEDAANKSTDVTLADLTNTLFPTELAVKTYVDNQIATVGDDDITAVSFDGTNLTVDEGATTFAADLSALEESADIAANTAAIAAHVAADTDTDETNELSDIAISGTTVTLTNAVTGAVGVDLDATFATDTELTAAIAAQANTNFAENDLTLNGDRIHDLAGNNLVFDGAGNFGIGDNNPDSKLQINGETRSTSFASAQGTAGEPAYSFYTGNDTNTGMYRPAADEIGFSVGGNLALRIDEPTAGNTVVIVQQDLEIGGTVTVQGILEHPDYVFQKYFNNYSKLKEDYSFQSLKAVETFVKKYHHLPGIQSAKEIELQGGFDLGKASKLNLEKIEELFLHTIEQEKKIDQLKAENKALDNELQALKTDLELIKKILIQKQKD